MTRPASPTASRFDRVVSRVYRSPAGVRVRRVLRRLPWPASWTAPVHDAVDRTRQHARTARRVSGDGRPSGGPGADATHLPDALPPGVTPFVVLASGRTGSSLLVTELNRRWSEIRAHGEEFRLSLLDRTVDEGIQVVWFTDTGHQFVGCKIFREHLGEADLRRILAIPGMRVVILRRANLLRSYVSLQIASRDGRWRADRHSLTSTDDRRVEIDLRDFLRYRELILLGYEKFERLATGLPTYRVLYETLASDLDAELGRIAAFLGAGPATVDTEPALVRQNPEPLRLLVANHDTLRRELVRLGIPDIDDPDDPVDVDDPDRAATPTATPGWPDPIQRTVLHLALDPPERTDALLGDWLATGRSWSPDDGIRRLLPLVRRRVGARSDAEPLRPMLDQAWITARGDNLRLVHALADVLDRLADAAVDTAVDTLVLKGAALALLHYEHLGDRPMHDLDLLVRPGRVTTALAALRADGWTFLVLPDDTDVERLLPVRHSVALTRGGVELDLHWHVMVESVGTDLDDALWAASVPLDVRGRPTRALGPADQVLHAVVHGLRWNPVPTIRWVADAHTVIASAGDDLDWRRLAGLARRYGLAAPVGAGVGHLADEFPGLVPEAGRAVVASVPVSARERRIFEHGLVPHGPGGTVLSSWYRYRRRVPHRTAVGAVPGFVHDMMRQLDLDHVWQVPGRVAREARLRTGRGRSTT